MFKSVLTMIIFAFILIIIISIIQSVAIIEVVKHPELIGQFFGEIIKGFNSVK
jgi:uncharacterized membrane protein